MAYTVLTIVAKKCPPCIRLNWPTLGPHMAETYDIENITHIVNGITDLPDLSFAPEGLRAWIGIWKPYMVIFPTSEWRSGRLINGHILNGVIEDGKPAMLKRGDPTMTNLTEASMIKWFDSLGIPKRIKPTPVEEAAAPPLERKIRIRIVPAR